MGNQQGTFDIGPRLERVAEGGLGVARTGIETWAIVDVVKMVFGLVMLLVVVGVMIYAIAHTKGGVTGPAAEAAPLYSDDTHGYDYNSGLDAGVLKLDPAFAGYTNRGEYGHVVVRDDPYQSAHFRDPVHTLNVAQVTSFIS